MTRSDSEPRKHRFRRIYPGHPFAAPGHLAGLANPIVWARLARRPARLLRWLYAPPSVEDRNLRNVLADGVGVGLATGIGSFLPIFLVRLGASDFLIGLLTAMPALTGMFLAMPTGRFLSRQRRIVPWLSYARFLVLSCYMLTGLVPFLFSTHRAEAILLIWALATVPQTIVSVSFTVVMGAVAGPRGRFTLMSRRWSILGLTSALAAFIAGQALETMAFPLNYQIIFLSAAAGGLISLYFSAHIELPDQEMPPPPPKGQPLARRLRNGLRQVLDNREFVRFLTAQFVFRWGLMLPIPLIPIYWVRQVGASDSWIGILNTTQSAIVLIAYFLWNRISRRWGKRFTLLASTLGVSLYPALTALTGSPEPLILLVALFGAFRAGMNLVFFDLALATCPERDQPFYIGIYQTTNYVATFLAPLLGTILSTYVGIVPALMTGAGLGLFGFILLAILHVSQAEAP